MPYCICNNGNVSDEISNEDKGSYKSNSICFSITLGCFFSKCLSPQSPHYRTSKSNLRTFRFLLAS